MIERIAEYPGYLIRFRPEKPSDQAVLLLHGFPAHRGTKNLDIADLIYRELNCFVYILHYKGLGESRGTFKFTESVQEAIKVAQDLAQKHKELFVVGHSWGGLVAVNLAVQVPKLKKVILMSPLVDLVENSPLRQWMLEDVKLEWPGVYGEMTQAEVIADLKKIIANHLPIHLAPKIPSHLPFYIIQAKQDDTTPATSTKVFASKCTKPPVYVELDMDHSFTQGRLKLIEKIVEYLRS